MPKTASLHSRIVPGQLNVFKVRGAVTVDNLVFCHQIMAGQHRHRNSTGWEKVPVFLNKYYHTRTLVIGHYYNKSKKRS